MVIKMKVIFTNGNDTVSFEVDSTVVTQIYKRLKLI